MLNFPPAVRIWLATTPVDLRRSFDRLAAAVRDQLHNDPLSGSCNCSASRRPVLACEPRLAIGPVGRRLSPHGSCRSPSPVSSVPRTEKRKANPRLDAL
jgi:transposase